MSTRVQIILGLALAGIGGVTFVILLAVTGFESPRDYFDERYSVVSSQDDGRSKEYSSPEPPSMIVESIAGRWPPAERVNDASGFFLRYRNEIVAVMSDGAGGSRIYVDDEEEGYRHWYGYVGGYWGTYSSRAEDGRGGGPGAGNEGLGGPVASVRRAPGRRGRRHDRCGWSGADLRCSRRGGAGPATGRSHCRPGDLLRLAGRHP